MKRLRRRNKGTGKRWEVELQEEEKAFGSKGEEEGFTVFFEGDDEIRN